MKLNRLNLLDELFDQSLFNEFDLTNKISYDVIENEDQYTIDLELAGYEKKNINVEVEENVLIVTANRIENEELKYNYKNSFFGKKQQKFKLPKDIVIDSINASYENGILKITLEKDKDIVSVKQIKIK